MSRLAELEGQGAASVGGTQPNLADENLRGYVLLLSAHFQGFCRDLYTECAQAVVSKVRPRLQLLIQSQFNAGLALEHGNPNLQNIRHDFERFRITLDLPMAAPGNQLRLDHLATLNKWRNIAAHHGTVSAGVVPLSIAILQQWRTSCDGLAVSLDALMYNHVRRILRRDPW